MKGQTDVVISGISGVFPKSSNVEEFRENLMNAKCMIEKQHKWGPDFKDIPSHFGSLDVHDRFDCSFFRVHPKQGEQMDTGARLLLEKTFEAITDAGYNLKQIQGTNTGVFYAAYGEETTKESLLGEFNAFSVLGKAKALVANRISYWLDVNGPSVSMDTACSSGLYALDMANKAIQSGDCDAAIVCASNACLSPYISRAFLHLGILNKEGDSRPFDAEANGLVRGEAVVVLFLQKKEDAKRVYAHVIHTKSNCDGFKEEGIACPSGRTQKLLYQQFYDEIGIDPNSIPFLETHGTGTTVGDVVEAEAIDEFFCTNRTTPLKIGSVKSNMGHAEACAALCSIAKLIIAFESGVIPPNVNFDTPNPKIAGFQNGHLEVPTKPFPLEGDYFGVSSFGVGGANAHALLSPFKKEKKEVKVEKYDGLPYLVSVSGRTDEAVNAIFDALEANHTDLEYIRLMHEIFSEETTGHLRRGFIILKEDNDHKRHIQHYSGEKRPLWFVFSGMGSQWPAMGKSLMTIPLFAESIQKSHAILENKGLDLIKILTDDDPTIFDNILHSFVGIAAIQIALIDVLNAIGITPDGIIGHSVGELGCAYADGCFTAEQMILAAYYRGLVSKETKFIDGVMAAVGESYDVMKDLVPPEIDIACHNGPTSCTISGPTDAVREFMKELKEKNIFVAEVNTSHIAYHSRYIASAGPKLISYLSQIVPESKLRSDKWLCTSAPEHEWNNDTVKYCSAEYHTNNLLHPVYFEETSRHIPSNAIIVEVAPHGLLQAILKRSFPSTVDNIALTLKKHENNTEFFLSSLGQLYEVGIVSKLHKLYPSVPFPVSRSTPMISPHVKWQHNEQWQIPTYGKKEECSGEREYIINLPSENWEFLSGHVIDERNIFPAIGYLELAWETIAQMHSGSTREVPVIFENIRFERATLVPKKGYLHFHISVQATGHFEIIENNMAVVTGNIRVLHNADKELLNKPPIEDQTDEPEILPFNTKDFYKELRLRGYHYKGLFKKVVSCNNSGTYGKTLWCDNFISFIDTMAQITIINFDTRELIIPTFIRKMVIDPKKHFEILETLDKDKPEFPVNYYTNLNTIICGGVQITDMKGTPISRKRDCADPVLEKNLFIPYISEEEMNFDDIVRLCVHIALENIPNLKIKTFEILNQPYKKENQLISASLAKTLADLPMIQAEVNVLAPPGSIPDTVNPDSVSFFETPSANSIPPADAINAESSNNNDLREASKSPTEHIPESNEKQLELDTKDDLPSGVTFTTGDLPEDKSCLIVVLSDIRNNANDLEKVFKALKDEAFIITEESATQKLQFSDLKLNVCFSRNVADKKIVLLRKVVKNKPVMATIKVQNSSYSWISQVQKTLVDIKNKDELLIVYAEKEPMSGIQGFFNCLRREENGHKTRCFFIMDQNAPNFALKNKLYKNQFEKNLSHNVYKNGQWGSYRHLLLDPPKETEVEHAYSYLQVRGDLSTLKWVEGEIDLKNPDPKYPLIHVYYSALNFRDVLLTTGRLIFVEMAGYSRLLDAVHGNEFSGRDNDGTRYMGITFGRAISTLAISHLKLLWKVPDHMTLEEAATIPIAYATVIHAFIINIKMNKNSSVLIHAAAGALGQAAINICLHYECNIFVTVGTPEKVEFIKKTFPQIPETNIGHSRDTSFEQLIMEQTNGKGVNYVLNSLSEDKLHASLRCVAKHGHFIEVGKYDMIRNNFMDMGPLIRGITFHSIQLDTISDDTKEAQDTLINTMQDLIDEGVVKPLITTVFERDEVETAIRYMMAGKHIGKVLIKIRDEEKDLHSKPIAIRLPAQPRLVGQKDSSYIIIGGLGGFGLELTDWLVLRGVRNIVLSSRTGIKNGYQSYRVKLWRSYEVKVIVSTEDVTTEKGVSELLKTANSLAPVAAIFNVAVILKDDPFDMQSEETFRISAGPKAIATMHLDKLTRTMCPKLKHFVVFSSVSCGRGNMEQTNYGMSNSVMERICEARRAENLPALAIQWGAIGEVGLVADLAEENLSIVIGGTLQQKVHSCLQTLDLFMNQTYPIVASMIVAEKRHSGDVIQAVANILGIKDIKTISLTWTLPELGMDSVMAVEIKTILESEFDVFLTPQDLKTMTFAKLYQMKEDKIKNTKTGEQNKSQQQAFLLEEKNLKKLVLRIPFLEDSLSEEISVRDNPTLFIFPGAESSPKMMEYLAKNLNIQSLCFQYYQEEENFEEFCKLYATQIKDRLAPEQKFYILSYSLGSIFAIEVAHILEKQGYKGYLWSIEGSPAHIQATIKAHFDISGVSDDEAMQCHACVSLMKALAPEKNYDELSDHLKNIHGWESKKKFCCQMFPKKLLSQSIAYKYLDKIYLLLNQAKSYESVRQLESPCVLIRTARTVNNLDENYGLSQYFKNPVQVHRIDADHFTILGKQETSDIIMGNAAWKKVELF